MSDNKKFKNGKNGKSEKTKHEKLPEIEGYDLMSDEEKYNILNMNEHIDDYEKEPLTDILDNISFVSREDETLFNRLPISKAQAEELLFDVYIPEAIEILKKTNNL